MDRHRAAISWLCLALSTGPALSEGAVAVGVPEHVEKQGVAQGFSVRARTVADAQATALSYCRDVSKSTAAAVALCKIVRVFHDQCVAFALDPQPGTPGYGWGVGIDKESAIANAMAMCLATAGGDRQQYCRAGSSDCDRGSSNEVPLSPALRPH
jgi:hypothetical protein